MRKNQKSFSLKAGAVVMTLLLVIISATPVSLSASICGDALGRCGVDALISGIFGGYQALLAYGSGCVIGYHWCMRYYI